MLVEHRFKSGIIALKVDGKYIIISFPSDSSVDNTLCRIGVAPRDAQNDYFWVPFKGKVTLTQD